MLEPGHGSSVKCHALRIAARMTFGSYKKSRTINISSSPAISSQHPLLPRARCTKPKTGEDARGGWPCSACGNRFSSFRVARGSAEPRLAKARAPKVGPLLSASPQCVSDQRAFCLVVHAQKEDRASARFCLGSCAFLGIWSGTRERRAPSRILKPCLYLCAGAHRPDMSCFLERTVKVCQMETGSACLSLSCGTAQETETGRKTLED